MNRIVTAALLATAASLLPSAAPAQTVPTTQVVLPTLAGTRLDVVATGESRQAPDIAEIQAGVVTEAPTAQGAIAQNATKMAAVMRALGAAGVAERDIRTSSLSLNPQYDYIENEGQRLRGYQAVNQLTITFREIAEAGGILDALVGQGINQINGPNLRIDEPQGAMDEARRDAIAIARARADLYAQAAGLRVRRILSISEQGSMQPPMPMPMYARAEAAQDATAIAPGEQQLEVTLLVSFELE